MSGSLFHTESNNTHDVVSKFGVILQSDSNELFLSIPVAHSKESVVSVMRAQGWAFYFKNQNERGGKSLGMIAQQVQEVLPSLVTDGDPLTLNYAGLSVVAVGAIQELHELLQDQQAIIETQNARIARLEAAMGSR